MAKAVRSPEGIAIHRAKTKDLHRKKRLDPEYRAREALKARERYLKNKGHAVAIIKKWQDQHREEICAKRRQWRRDNPSLAREADKRDRESSIKYAIARVRDGTMGLSELNQRIHRALIRVNDRTRRERDSCNDSSGVGQGDPGANAPPIGCLQGKKGT